MEKPDVAYYCLADLYGDEVMADESVENLDEDEITELILEDLESQYGERPSYLEVYIRDEVGYDTEIEVLLEWEE